MRVEPADYPGWAADTVEVSWPTMCIVCLDEQPAMTTMTLDLDNDLVCPDCVAASIY